MDPSSQRDIDHKRIQDESLLRMAMAISRMGAWSVDLTANQVTWSDQVCDIHEMPRGHAPTFDEALAYYNPEHAAKIVMAAQECIQLGVPFDLELELVTAKKNRIWVRSLGEVVRDASGKAIRLQGAFQDVTKRKEEERRRQELEERLSRTLECISDAFMVLDRAWCIRYLNPAGERMLDRTREFVTGRNMWDLFPEAVGSSFELMYRTAMDTGIPGEIEEYYPPLNAWFHVRAFPYDGGLAVYFTNVTAIREAREKVEQAEQLFRLLSKATNDAIWDWNLETNALWWNEGFETLFGYRREELSPTINSWHEHIHPDDRFAIRDSVQVVINGDGEHWSGEYRFRRQDGSYAFVLDRGHVIRDASGKALRMVGGMTDLTERKAAEMRLEEQAALLDQASDAILVRDLDNRVLYWNRRAEELYGWTAEEALGRSVAELIYEDRSMLMEGTAAVLRDGEWSGELQHRSKDGETATVFGRWTLLHGPDGQPRSILALNADITDRKRMEMQFLRKQRMESIGTLASGIAHDLNNILSPIVMSIEMLKEQTDGDDALSLIDTLHSSAQRGADLVRQILGIASGMDASRSAVCPVTVIEDIHRIVKDTFPRNIDFRINVPEGVWRVNADATQLHQVLMNLCVNARDAMPNGGLLTVSMANVELDEVFSGMNTDSQPGPYVVIRVEDTGVGMSKEIQEKVFEPFFTTKELGRGTGLGLSTTFTIIKNHGGFLHLYSELGVGTKFKVYLPAVTKAYAPDELVAARPLLPRGNGELILLVDDEENVRDITSKALERFGYRVVTAANGAEGVALYAQLRGEIAAVLTDMSMPVMDGPAMIAALKVMDPGVRIVGSSGLSANGHVAKAAGAGVEHFVPKPYTAELLLTTMRRVLGDDPAPQIVLTANTAKEERNVTEGDRPTSTQVEGSVRILVVEDEAAIAELTRRMLEIAGYAVTTAPDGESALEVLDSCGGAFDVVISDMHMPRLDGEGLYQAALPRYPHLRFIFASGEANLPGSLAGASIGVLIKPYSSKGLKQAVAAALQR